MKKSWMDKLGEKNMDLVSSSLLFEDFSLEELNEALTKMKAVREKYKKEENIFVSGKPTSHFGLVLSGSVRIESNDFWGNRIILSHVGAGGFFAEAFALLQTEPMAVDVKANEDCLILMMETDTLKEVLSDPPLWKVKLLKNLLNILIHKNLTLSARNFHTAPKTVRGRVMAYLNYYSLKSHQKEFNIPFNRQQMADYLNLDRSALSKELGKMRDEGLIRFHKNHFIVCPQAGNMDFLS